MSKGRITALVGAGVVIVGLVVGLIPVSSGKADCGSALNPESSMALAFRAPANDVYGCESLISLLRIPTWGLLAAGVLVFVIGWIVHDRRDKALAEARNAQLGSAR